MWWHLFHVYHSLISLFANTSHSGTGETSQAEGCWFPSWCMNDSSISVHLSSECQVPLKEIPFSDDWWRPVNKWKCRKSERRKWVKEEKSKSSRNGGNVVNTLKLCYFLMCNTSVIILLLLSYILGLYTAFFNCFYLWTISCHSGGLKAQRKGSNIFPTCSEVQCVIKICY